MGGRSNRDVAIRSEQTSTVNGCAFITSTGCEVDAPVGHQRTCDDLRPVTGPSRRIDRQVAARSGRTEVVACDNAAVVFNVQTTI